MGQAEDWVLLAYRLPRVPSTPRSAVWRKLKRLGVAQLGDGLVALPADPRTREQLDWIAEEVTDHGGEATLWLGRPLAPSAASLVVSRMTAAVAAEYEAVAAEAATMRTADGAARRRAVARLAGNCTAFRAATSSPARKVRPPGARSSSWLRPTQPGRAHEVGNPAGRAR